MYGTPNFTKTRTPNELAELAKSLPPSSCKTTDFDVARIRLGNFIVAQANRICDVNQIGYEESDGKCANTYEECKLNVALAIAKKQPVYVMKSEAEHSIYVSPHFVWALRFWHEWLHFMLDADFSPDGEHKVSEFHRTRVEQEFGKHSLEAKLCIAETSMQVQYFAMHGEFVKNQLEFARAMIKKY
jgi:hypothetical protein